MLWATAPLITNAIEQFPINSNGTLGPVTTVTLPGVAIPFVPSGPATSLGQTPTAVWAFFPHDAMSVFPVSSTGAISSVASQESALPTGLVQADSGGFAYGNFFTATGDLATFTTAQDGTLTLVSNVPLPPGSVADSSVVSDLPVPNVGGTIDLYDAQSVLVYPVTSTGVVGSLLQQKPLICISCLLQGPLSHKVNPGSAPPTFTISPLPTLWQVPGYGTSNVIPQYALNSDGSLNATPTNVPAPPLMENNNGTNNLVGLTPGQGPFSYAIDISSGAIYGYGVGATGKLTALGKFNAPLNQQGEAVTTFPPEDFTNSPVALFVTNGGTGLNQYKRAISVNIYSLCGNGMPSSSTPTPVGTISVPFSTPESFVVLNNGAVVTNL